MLYLAVLAASFPLFFVFRRVVNHEVRLELDRTESISRVRPTMT